MVSSTPGGIDIGVRPSLDGLEVDAENWRRAAGVAAGAELLWKAGTRKEGSVITDGGDIALAFAGVSIIVVLLLLLLLLCGDWMQRSTTSRCVVVVAANATQNPSFRTPGNFEN